MDQENQNPLIIAHRGSSALAPENTIAAFSRALKDGSEGIEFDVKLTRDGVPVVFHDSNLKRIAGSDVRISSIRSSELGEIDAGSWFNQQNPEKSKDEFVGEKIPTLETVMDFLKDFTGSIYVELKSSPKNFKLLSAAVADVLEVYCGKLRLIVKSFNFDLVLQVAARCPGIETAALFAPNILNIIQKETKLIKIAKEMQFERLSLHFSLVSRKLMQRASEENLPVTIWTADSAHWIKKSMSLGIDSVITNDPAAQLAVRDLAFSNASIAKG